MRLRVTFPDGSTSDFPAGGDPGVGAVINIVNRAWEVVESSTFEENRLGAEWIVEIVVTAATPVKKYWRPLSVRERQYRYAYADGTEIVRAQVYDSGDLNTPVRFLVRNTSIHCGSMADAQRRAEEIVEHEDEDYPDL